MLSQPAAAAAAAAAASPSPSVGSAEEPLQQRDAPLGVSNEAKAIHDSVDKLMKHMGQKVDLAAQRRMLGRLDMQESKTVLTAFSSIKKHFINRGKNSVDALLVESKLDEKLTTAHMALKSYQEQEHLNDHEGVPISMQVDEECVLRSADSSDPRELLKLVELQAYVTQLNTLKQQNKQLSDQVAEATAALDVCTKEAQDVANMYAQAEQKILQELSSSCMSDVLATPAAAAQDISDRQQ
ncbi:unnamed protein product [Vitrella brassicaformis CCMP3155]|uniref:Uncharacterized protein n=1 Tax=Vitrella brassicaformis (strain CCMP3155) TaxID=1169540 RepID=A0A0G4FCP1_VITBC|nr:unnamed protein product [Vitrella brassicaformis CCMP3155]|eukprot:CEM11007.1 unnamed protein product [Vitrella brassicaformis CCMP3155]